MEVLGLILLGIGGIISLIYGISLLIKAFQVSLWWGLAYLFIPIVPIIFVIVHWPIAKDPFLKGLIAFPFIVIGLLLLPGITADS